MGTAIRPARVRCLKSLHHADFCTVTKARLRFVDATPVASDMDAAPTTIAPAEIHVAVRPAPETALVEVHVVIRPAPDAVLCVAEEAYLTSRYASRGCLF